jgi:hypothetical protein
VQSVPITTNFYLHTQEKTDIILQRISTKNTWNKLMNQTV